MPREYHIFNCIDKLFQCLCLGGIKGCNENVAGTVAQELIDQAVSAFPFPEDIVDYIKTSKESIISSLKGEHKLVIIFGNNANLDKTAQNFSCTISKN